MCHVIAARQRRQHPAFYERTADETEALLLEELEAANAEDLGEVDTFKRQGASVLAYLMALMSALAARHPSPSFLNSS